MDIYMYIHGFRESNLIEVELASRETRTRRVINKQSIYGRVLQDSGSYPTGKHYTAVVRIEA